ncbi:MAG TPA: NHLP bacteriocin system secretion protein [Thermoanaerobaculia bacterium]|nr:NHLP bacteriocin system secretion protein [Thermoanaerobaculia bacterium]
MIYRKVALERLSSPEQLDQLIQVTRPRGWLALAALGGLLAAGLVWGIWGSIPTEAMGEGILLRGGVSELVAPGSGQVDDVLVSVGDVIAKNQVVAHIRQEVLQRQLVDARSQRQALLTDYREALAAAEDQRRLKAREIGQQRANLKHSIATLEREGKLLEERIEAEAGLLADGLITKQEALLTEQSLNAKRDQQAAQRLELNGLDLRLLDAERVLDQQLEVRQSALRDLDLELRELETKLREDVNVRSSQAGRVLEVLVDRGDVVNPGSPVLSLEVLSEELVAVLFVPAATGKQVHPGMEVRLSPSTVKREEYGALLGRVRWVADYPSTARGMTRFLGNEALVTRLMQQGPPVRIDVALERDPTTHTGYAWSSSLGPNLQISSGTLATGSVVVRRERPIRLVIPLLRERLGV